MVETLESRPYAKPSSTEPANTNQKPEAEDSIKDASDTSIRDITLIASAQQVEHHEIAVYGTLRTWANILGLKEDARVLESILSEEKQADVLLSSISDGVNLQAAA